jgi:5-methylcytosine-specific restriction protein A
MKEETQCEFCGLITLTRGHHVVPKSKGGKETVQACETCESYIHRTWSHNQLRDVFNSLESILSDEGFQKFLKWRRKQPATTLFKSDRGKYRDKHKYR